MNTVEPIRDSKKIEEMKNTLLGANNYKYMTDKQTHYSIY